MVLLAGCQKSFDERYAEAQKKIGEQSKSIDQELSAKASEAALGEVERRPSSPDALMDRIEALVKLPKEAYPLGAYSRHYAFADEDHVRATYLVRYDQKNRSRELCRSGGKVCSKEEWARSVHDDDEIHRNWAKANERRWFSSPQDLPRLAEGGCLQVAIDYDIGNDIITNAHCNTGG